MNIGFVPEISGINLSTMYMQESSYGTSITINENNNLVFTENSFYPATFSSISGDWSDFYATFSGNISGNEV